MNDEAVRALAEAAGLEVRWHDYLGQEHEVAPDTLRAVLNAMDLPCATPAQAAESRQALPRAAAEDGEPSGRAPEVSELTHRVRPWGLSVQLYSLRRAGDGGLGDFTALADCARAAARAGADALAISPVHAPFLSEPARHSPYMPSSRLLLNPLHVDPAHAARSLGEEAPPAGAGDGLERHALIDWPAAGAARCARLRALFARVASRLDADQEFRAFRDHGGEILQDHARFEALQAWQVARGAGNDWRQWPAALRNPRSAELAQFAREQAGEVAFHVFMQWLADRGLAAAQAAARYSGMAIGLVADLAIGADPAGSEAWSQPQAMLRGLSIGAPPDRLNTRGQNWGLTTFSPRALRQLRGAPLRELLHAALRHAGGVRIDHVLGLNRLWVIPHGASPTQGVYLRCPLGMLLDTVAQEARRHGALVIGEDLGTVPEGLRPRLEACGLMGLRVLWFMREHGRFVEPSRWPATAVATTTTHDLPTAAGWWRARDLEWSTRSGQLGADEAVHENAARAHDRRALWDAFLHAGVIAGDMPGEETRRMVDAAVRFVARAPAKLALIPIEDIAGLEEQPNLPGTTVEHPNWLRRLPAETSSLLTTPEAAVRLASLREERM